MNADELQDLAGEVLEQLKEIRTSEEDMRALKACRSQEQFVRVGMRIIAAKNRQDFDWLWPCYLLEHEVSSKKAGEMLKAARSAGQQIDAPTIAKELSHADCLRTTVSKCFRWFARLGKLSQCRRASVVLDLGKGPSDAEDAVVAALAEIDQWLDEMDVDASEEAPKPETQSAATALNPAMPIPAKPGKKRGGQSNPAADIKIAEEYGRGLEAGEWDGPTDFWRQRFPKKHRTTISKAIERGQALRELNQKSAKRSR